MNNKKSITQAESDAVYAFFAGLSKPALADAVIDLVRRNQGDENLDGMDLVTAIAAEIDPVMVARDEEKSCEKAVADAKRVDAPRVNLDADAKVLVNGSPATVIGPAANGRIMVRYDETGWTFAAKRDSITAREVS